LYIKASHAVSQLVSSFSHKSSIYSSSLLSYFYSASSERSSGASSRQELIYNEPSSSTRSSPSPPTPPPPPLPKRNSIIYPSPDAEHSLTYGPENNSPHLRINLPGNSSTLESRKSKQILRRTSLPPRLITHELTGLAHDTPLHSESESLVIESTQYVRDIQKRRDNIHATLLRDTNPGDRLRRMLGYRIEQRLVKVLSTRKSRNNTKKRPHKKKRNLPFQDNESKYSYKKSNKFQNFFSPPGLLRKLTKKIVRRKNTNLKNYIFEDFDDDMPSDIEGISRSPTPRFIVDRQGAFRWPPIRIGEEGVNEDENTIQPVLERSDQPSANLGIENFTLKKPSTETSSDAPCVLGWLQVKTDSHVFTPAIAHNAEMNPPAGPFRKAPFHANMHVLKTKI